MRADGIDQPESSGGLSNVKKSLGPEGLSALNASVLSRLHAREVHRAEPSFTEVSDKKLDDGDVELAIPVSRRRKRSPLFTFFRDVAVVIVFALLLSFLLKTFVVRSFYIPSGSMENTLQINDRIFVNELIPKVFPLDHGDVVVFRDPGGWLPQTTQSNAASPSWFDNVLTMFGLSAADSNDHLVKRVIGLPGDRVVCCNALGQMSVNGIPLKEPYLKDASSGVGSSIPFDVTVPKDSLWVMGDNRNNSRDSRYSQNSPLKGFVPIENVVGKAFAIFWPSDRWGVLDNHPDVFSGVKEAQIKPAG